MSSPEERSPVSRFGISRSGSLLGEKSRSRSALKKDISVDEGDALKKISEEADEKLRKEKRKTDEARKYLHQKRDREQAQFSDEENENISHSRPEATSTPLTHRPMTPVKGRLLDDSDSSPLLRRGGTDSRPSSSLSHADDNAVNGIDSLKYWQEKYSEIELKYKDAMVSQAKLFDEKTSLVYQVESLKDELEDAYQSVEEQSAELQHHQSKVRHAKHKEELLHSDIDKLRTHIQYRDDFMQTHGLHLPTISEEDEEEPTPSNELQFFPMSEREELVKQINELKSQVEEAKDCVPAPPTDSLLRGEETKDIIRESTRLVSEYKNKLQIADSETVRLGAIVERLKGQVSRHKSQLEDMEKREDDLLKEKRLQSREVRRLQSLLDDIESENELLKRRVEQMRKRQKD